MERSENEMYKEGETGGKLSESEGAAEREGIEEKKGKRERFRLLRRKGRSWIEDNSARPITSPCLE